MNDMNNAYYLIRFRIDGDEEKLFYVGPLYTFVILHHNHL